MIFCSKCGAQLADDAAFCVQCGTPVNNAAQSSAQPQPNAQQPQYNAQPQPNAQQPQYNAQQYNAQPQYNPQPLTPEMDIKENKVMAVLAYLGLLWLIPMFAAKNSPYARYHVKQGVNILVFAVAYSILTIIINAIVSAVFPPVEYFWYTAPNPIATVISIILSCGSIFFLVLEIIGIVNAAQGKCKEIPVLGKLDFINKYIK